MQPEQITFMPLTFTANNKASCQGLSSLFSFRSVPSSTFVVVLSRSFFNHSFGARSSCSRVVSSYHACFHPQAEASCISLCHTEKNISHVFRTFGRERPPIYINKYIFHTGILICAFNLSVKFTTKFEFKFEI